MKWVKTISITIILAVLLGAIAVYVYLGTYVFPIAPHWVTQLPPNPPSPKIKHGEFSFKLDYEIDGKREVIEDKLICDFDGFEVRAIGGSKTRIWNEYYKNEQGKEIFTTRNSASQHKRIVLENIDNYKIVLRVGPAEYFMGEPDYTSMPELPSIQIYDINTGYYKVPAQSKALLSELKFNIISWYCDPPIENEFK